MCIRDRANPTPILPLQDPLKGVFPSRISFRSHCYGVRIHVRLIKKWPRKLRPVRRRFVATFTLISCRSYVILNFIYVGKATQTNYVNLRESGDPPLSAYCWTWNSEICNIRSFDMSFIERKKLNVVMRPFYGVLLFFFFFLYSKLYHHAN